MQRSSLPLMLALVTFVLSLLSGGYVYSEVVRTVPALVAVRDIQSGAELTPEMVRVVRLPAGGRPEKALYGPGQVAGLYAAAPIFEGQVITSRHVTASAPDKDPVTALAPGQRVVSVPIRAEAALGGAARPGDLVDVVAAWPGADNKPGTVEVLATGIKVVDLRNAGGISTRAAGSENGLDGAVPTSALLLLSSQQARAVVAAVESKAAIYLWLSGRERS